MTGRWLTILGVGEDGADGLSPAARGHVEAAALVVGGARHLALAAGLIRGERMAWPSPIEAAIPAILARRPAPVVALASGDPYCYGVGALLARHVPVAETRCLPAPSAFALACARLGWSWQDCAAISFCGRPIEALAPLLQPGARVLALSADAGTPAAVAAYLSARGFSGSTLHVLEALGGPSERIRTSLAAPFGLNDAHPLNTLAIEVVAGAGARVVRTHAELAVIGDRASVGPFAYLRPGTQLGVAGKIGTFVETKNSQIGDGAKVPHLSYVGDAEIGEGTNIGAGTIFANYDGVAKHRTVVGRHAKTGSNNTFVAPVEIGDGAGTAGGTVVRRNVPAGALAVSSAPQRNLEGWTESKRAGTAQGDAARAAREQQESTEG